jgi:ABC-type sugar transport system ATPase subunit
MGVEKNISEIPALLELKGISKAFPGVQALDKVSFRITQGEVHALLGANGAGKSTLIKILAGAVARDAGEIIFNKMSVGLKSPNEATLLGIACIFQEPALVPMLTVEQNIFLGHEKINKYGWINSVEQCGEVQELLNQIAPHVLPHQLIRDLRTSERQLVALIRALMFNPQLIIMDEPSASMTAQETERLFSAIQVLLEAKKSVLYVTHRLDEVFRIANSITVLRDGRHVRTCPISSVTKPELVNLIAGREIRVEVRDTGESTQGQCLLDVKNISRFGSFENISFKVHAGEIVALTGLVGAGQSEIVRAIYGADVLNSGQITYPNGKQKISSPFASVEAGLVMVPEDRKIQGIIPKMSVSDNLMLSSIQRHTRPISGLIRSRQVEETVKYQIDQLNIQPPGTEERALETLSGGNQQKVIIARGIESQAKVIILDQPTAGVDVGAKTEIHRIIHELASQGKGILLISLEVEEVLLLANRILVIRDGKLVRELSGISASSLDVMKLALDKEIEERVDGNEN